MHPQFQKLQAKAYKWNDEKRKQELDEALKLWLQFEL